jgi:hypothetical protein
MVDRSKSDMKSTRTYLAKSPDSDSLNLPDLLSHIADIKYPCTKKAIAISAENPKLLYKDFDFFVDLLGNENRIIKWTAIHVLGNLAQYDPDDKISKVLPVFYSFLKGREMITASNAIKALGVVARNKPEYRDAIMKEMLKVEKGEYYNKGELSPECRNIAIGNAIDVLAQFPDKLVGNKPAVRFVERQLENTRPSVRKRAEKLMKKIG